MTPTFGLSPPRSGSRGSPAISPSTPLDSSTPWVAASDGNLDLLQRAVQTLHPNISSPTVLADENGYTLLHAAASYQRMEVLEWLYSLPRSSSDWLLQKDTVDGDSALHYAGGIESATWLLQKAPALIKQVNDSGLTALEAKQAELDELMQDDESDDDDEEAKTLRETIAYLQQAETLLPQ